MTTTVVTGTLVFGRSVPDDMAQIRYLREATSHAQRLHWTLAGVPLLPLHTHVHLLFPRGGIDERSDAYAREWAAAYRYASFFYRIGPGFVTIKDIRPGLEPNRMVITEGAQQFLDMTSVRHVSELDSEAKRMLDDATEAGLLLRHDDELLVLPYRLRHWPVPYIAA